MEKNCNNCRFSSDNTEYSSCNNNPDSPTYQHKEDCLFPDTLFYQPIFKPSDMDLLAIESLRDGKPVYRENGIKGIVNHINKKFYQVESVLVVNIYPDKPCTDLTKDEVKEHLYEDVWMWNDNSDLEQYRLLMFDEGCKKQYITKRSGFIHRFKHASLTKPNL